MVGIYKRLGVPCTKLTGDSRMGEDVGLRIRISALEAGIAYLAHPLCLCVCVCARSLPAALAVLFALPLRGPYGVAYRRLGLDSPF